MKDVDIRYSTKRLLIAFLVISIVGVLFGIYGAKNNLFNSYRSNRESYYDYYNQVDNSLYKDGAGNSNFKYIDNIYGDQFIKSYVRSYKIANYPFTEEFKRHSNKVILDLNEYDGGFEQYSSYGAAIDAAKARGINDPKININVTEEPLYRTYYLTNDNSVDEFDPQYIADSKLSESPNNIILSGVWEDGVLKFTKDIDQVKNENRKYATNLKQAIREVYASIKNSGIQKLNFTYLIDTNSMAFKQYESSMNYEENLFPNSALGVVTGAILILLLGLFSNFEKMEESNFYKSILKVPFEIVVFGAIPLWFMCAAMAADFFSINTELIKSLLSPFYLLQILAISTIGVAELYLLYSLKDVFYNGFSSKVVNNSIVSKVFNFFGQKSIGLFMKSKNVSTEYLKDFDPGKRRNLMLFFLALLILGVVASNIVVVSSLQLIVLLIWVCLIGVIFVRVQKYIIELEDIEKTAKIISEGHYDIKIEENNSHFKGLAHNLNAITLNLDGAISNAIKSEKMKTDLIANVSHDLKTPLTSIINYSELVVEEENVENIKKYAQVINEKSLKLKTLIEDLFEAAKVSSENIDLEIEEIDFKQLIKQIIGEWEDKLEEKSITIVEEYTPERVMLNLDGVKTSRILDNLFSNIYKYALEGTRVYVRLYKNEKVQLIIKNISKYPLNISEDELMERFTRGDVSRNTEGSGLGLSIAKSLVNAQKGIFEIEIDGDLFKSKIEF
ncbi:MAG: HAMP domain-containing sensor histidine kinase [Peptoniphilus sp.]|uniref:sensor histidine kinase n=1 Tax=Peptoniphilus sp. TaxID=1971214 RepID=UPI002A75DE72|nr:HAMP domain-containing sensor histidine kinase [Peptoniphilus sp.]MDY2987305.1 HAMP domain-containing sensor histidine kinase [Peptoniphilus sp.]